MVDAQGYLEACMHCQKSLVGQTYHKFHWPLHIYRSHDYLNTDQIKEIKGAILIAGGSASVLGDVAHGVGKGIQHS